MAIPYQVISKITSTLKEGIFCCLTLIISNLYCQNIHFLNQVASINSFRDEQHPIISPDGQTIYFTIAKHQENIGQKHDKGDIWFSTRINGKWSAPVNAGKPLNNTGYNTVGGISQDGQRLYLFGHYNLGGRSRIQSMAVSQNTAGQWSEPQVISIPYFPKRSDVVHGYVSSDEKTLFLAAEGFQTQGAEDLYVSQKDISGKWEEPKNIGQYVNTSYQELSPWLSQDKKYLYFASNGHGGYGSFDIYRAERLDDTWTNWSAPVNIGPSVNSEGKELFYSIYSLQGIALYTTTKNSDGYGDIRMTPILQPAQDSVDQVMSNVPLPDEKKIKISGTIMEAGTHRPVEATIVWIADFTFQTQSNVNGFFSIQLPFPSQYGIKIEALGYVPHFEKIYLQKSSSNALNLQFTLYPVKVGTVVNLSNVLFERGTDRLLNESFDELDRVVEFMKKNPNVEIELAGHTDNRGILAHNVSLSKRRVDMVKKYLTKKGIKKNRISGKGYGGTKPIASNDTEATRKLNRRVEFMITKN